MENYNGNEILNGLLFVKSMAAPNNIVVTASECVKFAAKANVRCKHAVLDDTISRSVDREVIYDLLEYLSTGRYQVLIVNDIYDITFDPEDLRLMIDRINNMGISIFDLSIMAVRRNNYGEEC